APVTRAPINPNLGPDEDDRARFPAPGWRTAVAVLVIGGLYLAGTPQSRPARHITLGGGAGPARAVAFVPGGAGLGATSIAVARGPVGRILCRRIEPGRDRAVPCGPAIPGHVAAFSPDGAMLAVGDLAAVTLWDLAADEERLRSTFQSDHGRTFAL